MKMIHSITFGKVSYHENNKNMHPKYCPKNMTLHIMFYTAPCPLHTHQMRALDLDVVSLV